MPKKCFIKVKLPGDKPDCCFCCPLLGEIPKEERQGNGSQAILVCLGTEYAMSVRAARSKASDHDSKHPLKRPCDQDWERWMDSPYFGELPIRTQDMSRYRDPFVRNHLQFRIKFPEKRGPKRQP